METLTTGECAKLLGVNEQTIRRMVDSGELASIRLADDGWRRILRSSFEDLMQRRNIPIDWSIIDKQ